MRITQLVYGMNKKSLLITFSLLTLSIFLAMALLLGLLIRKELFMPTYIELEKQIAQKDIIRCTQAIEREIFHLSVITRDWAQWNEMYDFTEEYDEDFAASNLEMDTLTETGLDLIFIISSKGQILVDKIYDKEIESEISLPSLSAELFSQDQAFMKLLKGGTNQTSGILITERGPIFIAANTILPSSGLGDPRGILVIGRFVSEEIVENLKGQTQVSFSVDTPNFLVYGEKDRLDLLQRENFLTVTPDKSHLIGKTVLYDIHGNPALLITTIHQRDIYNQGLLSSRFSAYIISFSFASLAIMGICFFVFYRYKRNIQHKKTEDLVREKTRELSSLSTQLHALSEATTEGVMLLEDRHCIAMNRQAERMFGFSQGEFENHPTVELVIKEERERITRLIAEGREGFYETIGLRNDLSTFPLLVHGKSVLCKNVNLRAVALLDLTNQRQEEAEKQILEDKLQRSQKMESIGMLAGGVAHDLNNILSGVVTYPELLLMNLDEGSPFRKPLEEIRASGKKAAEVVADLLTVARGVAFAMVAIDINQLILDYLGSADCNGLKTQNKQIEIETRLGENTPNIAGSVIHVNKVIMNLITNGIEALAGRENGTITISTSVVDVAENPLALDQGKYVVVDIADNGPGISSADQEHIFEPFYSRKIKGRSGTGLGLAIVWNTMQDHNGTVTVRSGESGTKFSLYFPVTDLDILFSQEKIEINTIKGSYESILVVDDNEQQLDIAKQILIALNYAVHVANSGEEALDFLEHNKVDLVILDMIMTPGISGYETYMKAIELYPDQKALIASGFSVSEEVEQAKKLGVSVFIRKPYSVTQIGSAIKRILAEDL